MRISKELPEPIPLRELRPVGIRKSGTAFTLVELLVSIAVLVLLVVLISQMVTSASKVTNISQERMDADSQARAVFERMGRDFAGMIMRPDVDCSIYPYAHAFKSGTGSNGSNDCLYFFTSSNANSTADSHASLGGTIGIVGYRIWENSSVASPSATRNFSLERLGVGTGLGVPYDRSMLFLTTRSNYVASGTTYLSGSTYVDAGSTLIGSGSNGTYPTTPGSPDPNYHSIGDQVFRLEFGLLMKSGSYYSEGATVVQDMRNAVAIVATIAILDNSSRAKIPGFTATSHPSSFDTDMAALVAALKDGDTPAVADDWASTISKLNTDTSIAPGLSPIARRVAAANTRVYQRCFYLK